MLKFEIEGHTVLIDKDTVVGDSCKDRPQLVLSNLFRPHGKQIVFHITCQFRRMLYKSLSLFTNYFVQLKSHENNDSC